MNSRRWELTNAIELEKRHHRTRSWRLTARDKRAMTRLIYGQDTHSVELWIHGKGYWLFHGWAPKKKGAE